MTAGYGKSVDKLLWISQTKIILIDQVIVMHINEVDINALSSVMSGGNIKS